MCPGFITGGAREITKGFTTGGAREITNKVSGKFFAVPCPLLVM